ncbi:MAG: TonB-dependent receptor family protein [Paludibacter sp.]|nr:TonB-dependent receptor family protein [Paludibacter sp.]
MKNYKKVFFAMVLIFYATTLASQNIPNITVTVKDSVTAVPIGYATVELLNPTDSALIGGITNDDGFIAIPAQANTAKIRVTFIGYKTFVAPVTALDMNVFLAEDATELSEVTVEGANRINKIDRDVFFITKELKAGTATSRELLGKLNGVTYNPYDQSISVNGNSNVLILVDGIERDQNMAKTLSPDRIDRVEVIKDPVGKYAADGYRAVINIITKTNFSGIDINANTNPMFNFIDRHGSPSVFIQENSSLNILYTYKKLNIYTSYWNNYGDLYIPLSSENRYGDIIVKTPPMDYINPNMNIINNYNNITFGGDYLLKEGNTLALEVNYNTGFNKQRGISDLSTYQNDEIIGRSISNTFSRGTNDALQTTLTYKGKWSKKSNFEADFRYRYSFPSNYSNFLQGEMFSSSANNQTENFYRINLNYTYQFTQNFSMDFGYGAIIDYNNLHQNNSTLRQQQIRNRPSVYLSYAPVQKLSFKIGAMLEFFNQKFETSEQSQLGILPFANIMYKPSDKFSVTLKYNSYPSYPDINSLNTFTTQRDSLTWAVGNPDLKPSNFQRVTLDFNFLKYFTVSPYFSFDSKNFQQYFYEDNGQYYQSQVNADYKDVGANVSFTIPFLKQTFFWQNWLQVQQTWLSYNGLKNSQFSYMFNSFLFYSINKWDALVGAGIQENITKWAFLQGYNQGGNDIAMIMLQKNLFKKKLSITMIYVPPIPEGNFYRYSQDNLIQTPSYYSFSSAGIKLLKNLMIFQINYRFNQGKQVNVTKTSLDNDSNVKQKSSGIGL